MPCVTLKPVFLNHAGMGYALALYRRGQLGDAVMAHMTTNALIAVVVLVDGRWSLWF